MTEYFTRTNSYWLERAAVGFLGTGKVLRRRGFTMANYYFMDKREEIEQLEEDDTVVEQRTEARAKRR
jgi:hypothetical protein